MGILYTDKDGLKYKGDLGTVILIAPFKVTWWSRVKQFVTNICKRR